MHKKAQIGSGFTDIFLLLSIVVIAFIFLIILNFKGCGSQDVSIQTEDLLNARTNLMLISYLRTPVMNQSMEDLLINYFVLKNKSLKKAVAVNTKSFLNTLSECSILEVDKVSNYGNKSLIRAENKYCDNQNYLYIFWCSSTYLPSFDESNKLVVKACTSYNRIPMDVGLSADYTSLYSGPNWLVAPQNLQTNYVFVSDSG